MKDENINITEPARQQLEKFSEEMIRKLLDGIISEKSYPGLGTVEVTAEDIRRYSANMRYVKLDRATRLAFFARTYLFLGLFVVLGGIYFEDLKELSLYSPLRLSLIIAGVFMLLIGIFLMTVFPNRNNSNKKNNTDINSF
jgi:hypothetical protein